MSGANVVLDGRSGGLRTRRTSVDETIERLAAYAEAGADVVCAPGLADPTAIRTLVKAVAPKPVDVQLMKPGLRAAELEEMGVRRVSVGHSFAVACWTDFWRVAYRFMEFDDLSPESFPIA
jgi:2-methylisocitrate lyase-like PEP mutase family enzyme